MEINKQETDILAGLITDAIELSRLYERLIVLGISNTEQLANWIESCETEIQTMLDKE